MDRFVQESHFWSSKTNAEWHACVVQPLRCIFALNNLPYLISFSSCHPRVLKCVNIPSKAKVLPIEKIEPKEKVAWRPSTSTSEYGINLTKYITWTGMNPDHMAILVFGQDNATHSVEYFLKSTVFLEILWSYENIFFDDKNRELLRWSMRYFG